MSKKNETKPLQQTAVGRSTSMTAKEKAKDLILKYSILNDGHNHIVKECAKIAVKEIIEETSYIEMWLSGIEYWEKVLNEIDAF